MRCIRNPPLFYIAWRRDVACYVLLAAFRVLERRDVASNVSTGLSLVDRYVRIWVLGPEVIGAGTDQAIIIELLDYVRGPAADTRNREDGGEQVDVDAKGVI